MTTTKNIIPPLQLHLVRDQFDWTSKVFSYFLKKLWCYLRMNVQWEGIFFSCVLKFIVVKFKFIPAEFKNLWAARVWMQRVLWKLEAKNSTCGQRIIHKREGTSKQHNRGTKIDASRKGLRPGWWWRYYQQNIWFGIIVLSYIHRNIVWAKKMSSLGISITHIYT